MEASRQTFRSELRISIGPVIAMLAVLSIIVAIITQELPDRMFAERTQLLRILLYTLPISAWLISMWREWAGKAFTIFMMVALILLGSYWLSIPGTLSLLAIPTGLAAALMGIGASAITASGATLALVGLSQSGAIESWGVMTIALTAIWMTVGTMWALYRSIFRVTDWAANYYQRAQFLLEESRTRKADLEDALEDLAQANRQLILSNERMAAFRAMAEDAQSAKAAFVSKVSHEFRTPLNMIIGLTDLLLETPDVYGPNLPRPLVEDLQIVHRNCQHLSSMIDDVLAMGQLETGRLTLHREEVDLAETASSAVTVVQPLMQKKDLYLNLKLPEELPTVYCDRTRIRQVILNLVSNAARFTDEGGITVTIEEEGGWVTVTVHDTGSGIAPDDLERIFEPFRQASGQLWRDKGGTGLGLAISKQFIELHGGTIWVESELGVGSSFHFRLPIKPLTPPAARPDRWIQEEWEWIERRPQTTIAGDQLRPRIVVCDSSGEIYAALKHYTDEVEFVRTYDLTETFDLLERGTAHSLIVNAPTITSLWKSITQARRRLHDLPILGCAVPPQVEAVLNAGADDYLIKPVRRPDLEKAIGSLHTPVRRVLVVDDDDDVLRLLTRTLRSYDENLEVLTASNGEEALEQLRSNHPDLMLLDIVMPEMDGWAVLREKKEAVEIRDIPTVMISAQNPSDRPATSPILMTTSNRELSLDQLVRSSLVLTEVLSRPG
ncbi:MAG: ATP-binding protein [Anaerolineae bacterium]